ncbi:MAG TPA: hypothetical protein VES73_17450 [Lamprocystis sp. (in: g-proteobacteria)]|nr:hypothetical protein [Lamprocystis sp. (in: g-proteobacteria)]
MPSLQVRELPDDVYQALSLRAEREHRSLAQQAVVDLRRVVDTDAAARRRRVLAAVRAELNQDASGIFQDPEALIREDRAR